MDDPENDGEKIMVVGAADGTLQAFSALGDTLFVADTAIVQKSLTRDSAKREVPLYRVGAGYGPLVGMASDGKDVYSLHTDKLVKTSFASGIPTVDAIKMTGTGAVAGPIIVDDRVWVLRENIVNYAVMSDGEFKWQDVHPVWKESGFVPEDMAYCPQKSGEEFLAVVGSNGEILRVALPSGVAMNRSEKVSGVKGESFRIACTDIDRDGENEPVIVGSRGTVAAFKKEDKIKTLWTKNYKRGAAGTSGLKDETSGIALGDINDDGYPEIVFLGDNLVYALDRFGVPIDGFPVTINRGEPIVGFFSDPLLVDVTGDKVPETS